MRIYKFSNCYVDNNEKERKRPNKGIFLRAFHNTKNKYTIKELKDKII